MLVSTSVTSAQQYYTTYYIRTNSFPHSLSTWYIEAYDFAYIC